MPIACASQPGAALHLVQRSRARAACFFDERDRLAYLELLGRALERFACALHAYVLMGNHVHLLVTPAHAEGPMRLARTLGAGYSRHLAETHGDEVPAWDEPSLSPPLYARRNILDCMRYIELNPARAGIVRRPADFRWSSYRANALGANDPLVTPHGAYCALGRSAEARCAAYRGAFGRAGQSPRSGARREAGG